MASGFTPTSFAGALKTRYATDFVESMVYPKRPLLALVKKMQDMGGDGWKQPVLFEDPTSRSATFSTAQTASTSSYSRVSTFNITRIKDYGVITIDGELIEASKKDQDAFFKTVTQKIDGIMNATARSAATALYRGGYGAIGQINTPTASTTLTLANPNDVSNFAVGQVLVISDTEGASVLRAGTGTVAGVNRSAGTLTLSANVTTAWAAAANNDYIFVQGDRNDAATPARLKIAGLEAWCPVSAPASTSFFGVDRTADSRLGGVRFDGTGAPLEEVLVDAATLVQREGGMVDHAFLNPKQFGNLVKALGTKVQYVDLKAGSAGGIGFRALELYTPAGTVKVIPDQDCPSTRCFLLQLDTWMLGSLGMVPRILNHDGLESLRQASDDGIEIRVGYYGNLICKAPGWNCNIQLNAT